MLPRQSIGEIRLVLARFPIRSRGRRRQENANAHRKKQVTASAERKLNGSGRLFVLGAEDGGCFFACAPVIQVCWPDSVGTSAGVGPALGIGAKVERNDLVDLGFAQVRAFTGVHVCQIYDDSAERSDAVLRFVSRGVRNGEATACVSRNVDFAELDAWCTAEGIALAKERETARFTLSGTDDVYLKDGRFDPDRMIAMLVRFYEDAMRAGRPGARMIGEMSPAVLDSPGGSALLEYESRVNGVLREYPLTAVCQYEARAFDGATVMDLLTVHPLMVMHGAVIENPFFIPPEELASA